MTINELRWLRLIPLVVLALGMVSCEQFSSPTTTAPPAAALAVASPQKHWVQSERLAEVMDELSGLRGAFPRGLPDDAETPAGRQARHALSEAAAVADALAETATRIPAAIEGKAMPLADRRGFVAEAMRLHDQAVALGDAARANHLEPLQELLDSVNSTCISCHSRYRDVTGELNTHKAAMPSSAAPERLARASVQRRDD